MSGAAEVNYYPSLGAHDPVGNRTNSTQNGASVFNQANQLLEDAGFTYQYDNNGNLTRKTPKTPGPFPSYEYDAENKLVRAVINGTTVNYRYDGLGRRVERPDGVRLL
jgi:YD repeat-containing protein